MQEGYCMELEKMRRRTRISLYGSDDDGMDRWVDGWMDGCVRDIPMIPVVSVLIIQRNPSARDIDRTIPSKYGAKLHNVVLT